MYQKGVKFRINEKAITWRERGEENDKIAPHEKGYFQGKHFVVEPELKGEERPETQNLTESSLIWL